MSKPPSQIKISSYRFDASMSRTQRAAHFLDWAARNIPRKYVPYNIIVKATQGYGFVPKVNSDEAETLRKSMSRVREILRTTYRRGCDVQRDAGVRATVDSEDTVKYDTSKRVRRLVAAKASVAKGLEIVDVSSLPKTEDGRKLANYVREARSAINLLTAERIDKLLLTAGPDAKQPAKAGQDKP